MQLSEISQKIRLEIVKMLAEAGSGHPASALGMADLFAVLYDRILRHDARNPDWEDRDYLILSNGHTCPVLYATLALYGYFPKEELATLRKLNSRLQGHPQLGSLPGVETSSGPLGQGLSQACGLALGLKLDQKPNLVYCILSDAEQQAGQTWEAYMFGAANQLDNLIAIIDRNQIQIEGKVNEIMPIEPLRDKLTGFGWQVEELAGHNFSQLTRVLEKAKASRHQNQPPLAIIMHTTPGKGVSFMENDHHWHGKPLNQEQAQQAIQELLIGTNQNTSKQKLER